MEIAHSSWIPGPLATGCTSVFALGTFLVLVPCAIFIIDYIDGWTRRRALQAKGIPIVDEGSNVSRIFRRSWNASAFDPAEEIPKAYQKYSKAGKPFATRIQNDGYAVILPPAAAPEFRGMGADKQNFAHALAEFADMAVHMDVVDRTPVAAVNSCNTQAELKRFQSALAKAADEHLPSIFPQGCKDAKWTRLHAFDAISLLASRVAGSLTLGAENPLVVQLSDPGPAHSMAIFDSLAERSRYPRILRWLVWRLSPKCRVLSAHMARLRALLGPEIKRRVQSVRTAAQEVHLEDGDAAVSVPVPARPEASFSILESLITATFKAGHLALDPTKQSQSATDAARINILVDQAVLLHFELARGPSVNATAMLFRLLQNPEYIEPLRAEIASALGISGGRWEGDVLARAPRLESFCKETFRMDDISTFVHVRRVMTPQPLHLRSLNLSLDPGTLVASPSRSTHYDADNYAAPHTFNPARFYDAASNTCRPRISTTSPTFLPWTHGAGSCPGRMMATMVARVMLFKILEGFELRFVDGKGGDADADDDAGDGGYAYTQSSAVWNCAFHVPRADVVVEVRAR